MEEKIKWLRVKIQIRHRIITFVLVFIIAFIANWAFYNIVGSYPEEEYESLEEYVIKNNVNDMLYPKLQENIEISSIRLNYKNSSAYLNISNNNGQIKYSRNEQAYDYLFCRIILVLAISVTGSQIIYFLMLFILKVIYKLFYGKSI